MEDRQGRRRGYIGMLVVEKAYRKRKIGTAPSDSRLCFRPDGPWVGSTLVEATIAQMIREGCDEVRLLLLLSLLITQYQVVLEAEETNHGALSLYMNLGFRKEKRLIRYYLNGSDAFRLKLWLT